MKRLVWWKLWWNTFMMDVVGKTHDKKGNYLLFRLEATPPVQGEK